MTDRWIENRLYDEKRLGEIDEEIRIRSADVIEICKNVDIDVIENHLNGTEHVAYQTKDLLLCIKLARDNRVGQALSSYLPWVTSRELRENIERGAAEVKKLYELYPLLENLKGKLHNLLRDRQDCLARLDGYTGIW